MKMPPDERIDSAELKKSSVELKESSAELRDRIIGLGEKSFRKSYYPELQKKLEDLEQYKTLLDQSNDAIFLVKVPSGQFLSVSESAYRQLGFSEGEFLTIYDLLPGNRGELEEIFSGRTESTVFDARMVKRGMEETFYEVNMHRVRMGHSVYVVAVARDVTERKRVERELKRSEERLRLKLDSVLSPDVDLSEQELSNVIDTQALQRLMDDFYEVTRMGVGIIDLRGNVLVGTGWQEACTQYHRKCPLSLRNCLESDLQLTRGVKKGEFRAYKCKNNMWDIVTPLYIGDKHVGNVFLGQFFYDDEVPDMAVFEAQAERFGFDRDRYLAAIEQIPRWSHEKVESMIRFYARLADMISSLSFSNVKLARAMAEERLAEDRMRVFFERQLVGMAITSPEKGWLQVNDKLCQMLGYSREELSTITWVDLTHPDDLPADVAQFNRLLAGEIDDYTIEKRYIRKDGSELPVIISNGCVRKADGSVDYILTLIEDITDRKRADDALRESEGKFRALAETSTAAIFILQGDRLVSVNQTMETITGYPREELLRHSITHFIHPDFREMVLGRAEARQRGEQEPPQYEIEIVTRDGEEKWVLLSVGRIIYRGKPAVVGSIVDITDRKQAEWALQESEENLRLALDGAHMGMWNWNPVTGELIWSARCSEIFGLSHDTAPNYEVFLQTIHPEDRSRIDAAVKKALKQRTDYDIDMRVLWPDGSLHWVTSKGRGLYDAAGRPVRMLGIALDITERKRTEEERERLLQEIDGQRRRLETILESLPVSLFIVDSRGRIIMANHIARNHRGGTFPKTIDELAKCKISWEDTGNPFRMEESGLARALTRGETTSNELVAIEDAKGNQLTLISSAAPLRGADGKVTGAVLISLDITEMRKVKKELGESRRQAELYLDLMSHDITNMNQALMGCLEMMELTSDAGQIDMGLIDSSLEIIKRSSRMIDEVKKLTLVQAGKIPQKAVDVCQMLSAVKARYSNVQGRTVTINFTPGPECVVWADDMLLDALDSLAENAVRHSSGPVTIDLAVEKVTIEGRKWYEITVADTGPGIPDDLKKKIFMSLKELEEKAVRRGFGLYLVRTLVDHYGGKVWVEDRVPGDYTQGSQFVVQLPSPQTRDSQA